MGIGSLKCIIPHQFARLASAQTKTIHTRAADVHPEDSAA